jgi:hypothetical protein
MNRSMRGRQGVSLWAPIGLPLSWIASLRHVTSLAGGVTGLFLVRHSDDRCVALFWCFRYSDVSIATVPLVSAGPVFQVDTKLCQLPTVHSAVL